jgi:hypothetical protein
MKKENAAMQPRRGRNSFQRNLMSFSPVFPGVPVGAGTVLLRWRRRILEANLPSIPSPSRGKHHGTAGR